MRIQTRSQKQGILTKLKQNRLTLLFEKCYLSGSVEIMRMRIICLYCLPLGMFNASAMTIDSSDVFLSLTQLEYPTSVSSTWTPSWTWRNSSTGTSSSQSWLSNSGYHSHWDKKASMGIARRLSFHRSRSNQMLRSVWRRRGAPQLLSIKSCSEYGTRFASSFRQIMLLWKV